MKPVAATALLTGLAVAAFDLWGRGSGTTGMLTVLGVLGQVANAVISARWEWPINREINSWTAGPVLERYATLRDTWDQNHLWRTQASLLALICFTLAAVLRQRAVV
jgi:hypothetical protein